MTCDFPIHPVSFNSKWNQLSNLALADPEFGTPGRIDVLLGIDIFVEALWGMAGRRVLLDHLLLWKQYLVGYFVEMQNLTSFNPQLQLFMHWLNQEMTFSGNFGKLKNLLPRSPIEERMVLRHFESNHFRNKIGRFVVPLPKRSDAKTLGESRSQAVRRFLSLERSLNVKGQFAEFEAVMKEYMDLQHAEIIPVNDL